MTKEEVLQGALALNDGDRKYTVSIEEDKITIESTYHACMRTGIFRHTAHLNDDHTYVETQYDNDGRRIGFGKAIKVSKSISFSLDKENNEVESESFHSEDMKQILREYLDGCGYQRTNKGFFRRLLGK